MAFRLIAGTLFAVGLALVAQQTATSAPPRFLNLAEHTLNPGRTTAYQKLEAAIAVGYEQAAIQAYWIELQSITGPPQILYLNLFDSFNQIEAAADSIAAALPSHSDLAAQADQLLQENVTAASDALLERRDDLSFRPTAVNLGRMRILRLTTVEVRSGHDADFATAAHGFAAQAERDGFAPAWVVYQAESGRPQPTYVVITALSNLTAFDTPSVRRNPFQDGAPESFLAVSTQLYSVNAAASRVSADFAAADPGYWLKAQ